MGLDGIELVMALENSFGIHVPDEAIGRVTTVRDLIEVIATILPKVEITTCLSQRAFNSIREATVIVAQVDRSIITPTASIVDVLALAQTPDPWSTIGSSIGATEWPPVRCPRALLTRFRVGVDTFGDAADYLATYNASTVKACTEGWSWQEIEWTVRRMLWHQLRIEQFKLDDHLIHDLGIE